MPSRALPSHERNLLVGCPYAVLDELVVEAAQRRSSAELGAHVRGGGGGGGCGQPLRCAQARAERGEHAHLQHRLA